MKRESGLDMSRTTAMTEPHDVTALQDHVRAGYVARFVFFWGHAGSDPERIGKECLSQWYPASFTVDGIHYSTAEHYMMAEKARLFGDEASVLQILAAPEPAAAKQAGRKVKGFDDARWYARRVGIVMAGNQAKFSQHPRLRDYLLGTAGHVLVEASPTDRIWGIGLGAEDARAQDPLHWPGLNLLGFALMAVRGKIG